jgi:hypothetical protein
MEPLIPEPPANSTLRTLQHYFLLTQLVLQLQCPSKILTSGPLPTLEKLQPQHLHPPPLSPLLHSSPSSLLPPSSMGTRTSLRTSSKECSSTSKEIRTSSRLTRIEFLSSYPISIADTQEYGLWPSSKNPSPKYPSTSEDGTIFSTNSVIPLKNHESARRLHGTRLSIPRNQDS